MDGERRLMAISDLHVSHSENRQFFAQLPSDLTRDWLLLAGDVSERFDDLEWVFENALARYAQVVWSPGNHDLWTHPRDTCGARGVDRYMAIVELARSMGVQTPEDPYLVWVEGSVKAAIVPMFLGYDYTFLTAGAQTRAEGMAAALNAGVLCTDEVFLHPDPYSSREEWCAARVKVTEERLLRIPADQSVIFVNHYPMERTLVESLRYPEFALWCGTTATAGWTRKYRALAVVYGHLHIPRTIEIDGVPHHEVSVGYPREWRSFGGPFPPRQIRPTV